MTDDLSPVLSLPLLLPAQAQKHVTHNEALRLLDVLVQLAVTSKTAVTPPETPAEGQRHIVPAGASGAWAGLAGRVAVFEAGGWASLAPLAGWLAYVQDEEALCLFDGTTWQDIAERPLQPERLGINTVAEGVNQLAVAGPATLLTHAGNGHQLKINKAATGDTTSLLFQTNWSGRAEMGLAGHDDFSIKVSANGSAWFTGIQVAASTGVVNFPQGLTRAGSQVFAGSNILGTVSQSGGVPTGAVIERGSNANGDYVRFADGTQFAFRRLASSDSGSVTWTYPVAFLTGSNPYWNITPFWGSASIVAPVITTGSHSAMGFGVLNSAGTRVTATCALIAAGRWF